MTFRIHHAPVTASTNLDARAGAHGDVYTADAQTAGRGRLDHRWLSAPGANLILSAVFDVADLAPEQVATFPLVVGLAVHAAVSRMLADVPDAPSVRLKWPNDLLVGGRKIAGILCERHADAVIAGVGVNVNETAFPPEIAARATSLAAVRGAAEADAVARLRDALLEELGARYETWRTAGFAAFQARYAAVDWLKGRMVAVRQTDDDAAPLVGLCAGVQPDGTLLVGGTPVFAGEAHVVGVGGGGPLDAGCSVEATQRTPLDLSALSPQLRDAVQTVAELVRAAGGRAWMVGGSVRDLLLGARQVKDVDLEVFGLEPPRVQEVIGQRFAFDACGLSFGVLKLKHIAVDVALPRRESKRGTGHRGFLIDSDPHLSIPEAAGRRDFTVNALYYDPLAGALEDPYGGRADLKRRILRHVSPKFVEDPLRVLRGMQFVARFDLTPARETVAVCRSMTPEGLPPERLFEEWAKLLTQGVAIGRGLAFLRATDWVRYYPELRRLIGCRQDRTWHPEGDVWNHTCLCLDAFARRRVERRTRGEGAVDDADEDLVVGLAVLCHDFGKPATTRWLRGRLRSPGHDAAGVAPTLAFLHRLTNEERILKEVPPLVAHHMQPFALWKAHAGDAAIRRLALRVGRIDRLVRVAQADDEGRGAEARDDAKAGEELRWLAAEADRLRLAAARPRPILMGRDLIALGHRPSPQFKAWLDACFEAQLDGAFADHDGALAYFRAHVEPGDARPAARRD